MAAFLLLNGAPSGVVASLSRAVSDHLISEEVLLYVGAATYGIGKQIALKHRVIH